MTEMERWAVFERISKEDCLGWIEDDLSCRAYNALRKAGFSSTYGLYRLRKSIGQVQFNKVMKMLWYIGNSSINSINACIDKFENENKEVLR